MEDPPGQVNPFGGKNSDVYRPGPGIFYEKGDIALGNVAVLDFKDNSDYH